MTRATTNKNKLGADASSHLRKTALASGTVLLASLLFWGSLAPRFLLPSNYKSDDAEAVDAAVAEICLWSGFCATTILICHFVMVYLRSIHTGKPFNFIIYWFIASLFFDLVWEIPLWSTKLFSTGPSTIPFLSVAHLPYAIYWWSYSISDDWYEEVTPFVVATEIWYLFGNLFGLWGLYSYYCFSRRPRQQQQPHSSNEENTILVSFCICGILQCYNATLYMFSGWYIDGFESVHQSWRGKYIYWGLNGFWALASAVAARMSWNLLFSPNDIETTGKRE